MRKAFIVILSLWARWAAAATCSDIGYYCPENGRYLRVQYIELTGTQYLNTGIPLKSKYDMEMTWQGTEFISDRWATGVWGGYGTGRPTIYLTGMYRSGSDKLFLAMYDIDTDSAIGPNDVIIPFDTNIHTTYVYKDKGIWIDDESTLKAANYEATVSSNSTFLIGLRNSGACWTGRVYSFIFKNNGQFMAEFIPVYDTETEQYGMYDTVANTFHGNLGSRAFIGGDFTDEAFPCRNAPANAHYTGSGTANNCPWECDDGYVLTSLNTCARPCPALQRLNIGITSFGAYADRQTNPALVLRHQDQTCYINTAPGRGSGTLNIKRGNDIFHLVN